MAGFANDVMVADNVNFTGLTGVAGKAATVTTNGQLLIGSTAAPNIQVGTLTSPDSSITIGYSSPNITLQASGSLANSFPTDDGTGTPSSGVLDILGATAVDYTQSGMVTHASVGNPNQVYIENRLWLTKFVVDPSATIGQRGSYQTIAAALAAATAGTTIFIRPGTYTENLTAVPGVTLTSFETIAGQNEVTIVGKLTITTAGDYQFSNINFQTNADYAISCSGAAVCTPKFYNCGLTGQDHTIIQFSNSSGSSKIDIYGCQLDLKTTGIAYFDHSSSGTLGFSYTITGNSGGSSTSSTHSAGAITCNYTAFLAPYTSSGGSAGINAQFSLFNTAAQAVCPMNINSTNPNDNRMSNCYFESDVAACMTIGAGATVRAQNVSMYTKGANLTTGAGTLLYAGIASLQNDSAILNNTTKTALTLLPYAQSAASGSGSIRGTASFDSAVFTVTDGFVTLAGGGLAVDSFAMQTGTSPVVPTGAGLVTFSGAVVAAGTNPVRTDGTGANTMTLEIQKSQALASADATKIGLANFDSARFTCDSNGFVSMTGSAGMIWADQGSSITVSSGHGYFVTASIALTLPASPSVGDTISFFVDGAFTLTITANTGQKIKVSTALSSSAGTAANTASGDSMTLVYRGTNTQWEAINYVGAWNLA